MWAMHIIEVLHILMYVNLGSGNSFMAQQTFQVEGIYPMLGQGRGKGMSKHMWVEIYTAVAPNSADDRLAAIKTEWLPVHSQPNSTISRGMGVFNPQWVLFVLQIVTESGAAPLAENSLTHTCFTINPTTIVFQVNIG